MLDYVRITSITSSCQMGFVNGCS